MGLFGKIFAKGKQRCEMREVAQAKEAERAAREQEKYGRMETEWEILKECEIAPYMEAPDYDLSALFPFDNREYVCLVPIKYERATGEVLEESHIYYADREAIDSFIPDVGALEALLGPDVLGLPALPTLQTRFNLLRSVPRPVDKRDLPENSVRLTLSPSTPTGKKARYPVTVSYNAYKRTHGPLDGSHGTVSYLVDGSIGKAELNYWHSHIHYGARFKLIDGKIALSVLTYCDNPSTCKKVELYRAR